MDVSDDDILKKVQEFAAQAHGEQRRKYTDEPYIAHPIRVMEMCRQYTSDVTMLCAALLHDVLEDTQTSRRQLENFLKTVMDEGRTQRTLELVDELTDVFVKEDYPQMNRRKRRSKEADRLADASVDAQTIKYADIIDNTADIAKETSDFALVYLRECQQLLQRMSDGNHDLYERAVNTVNESLREYWTRANVKAL